MEPLGKSRNSLGAAHTGSGEGDGSWAQMLNPGRHRVLRAGPGSGPDVRWHVFHKRFTYETAARRPAVRGVPAPILFHEALQIPGALKRLHETIAGLSDDDSSRVEAFDCPMSSCAVVTRIFSEKISTRATRRPELERAVTLAREMRASSVAVTLVVHEHKRLGRGLTLAELAEQLRACASPWSSSPASCKAATIRPAWCSTCSRPCRGWHRSRRCEATTVVPGRYPSRELSLATIQHRDQTGTPVGGSCVIAGQTLLR